MNVCAAPGEDSQVKIVTNLWISRWRGATGSPRTTSSRNGRGFGIEMRRMQWAFRTRGRFARGFAVFAHTTCKVGFVRLIYDCAERVNGIRDRNCQVGNYSMHTYAAFHVITRPMIFLHRFSYTILWSQNGIPKFFSHFLRQPFIFYHYLNPS